jgi:REP element-mobilizing transposase RayT
LRGSGERRAYIQPVPRAPRRSLPDGIYHVTARGIDRDAVFRDDADRVLFLRLLGETVDRQGWICHAFCLMGTHYHLVVEATQAALSRGLQRLNGVYAQLFNRRHERRGHLFGGRFSAWVLDDEEYLQRTCDYIAQNPVRAGLCGRAEEWPWSSVRARKGR